MRPAKLAGIVRLAALELRAIGDTPRATPDGAVPNGDLRRHLGVPVLRLSGTPYDMGVAHGRLLGPVIRKLRAAYFRSFFSTYAAGGAMDDLARRSEALGRALPEALREEIEGLASGVGIPYREALFLQTFLDLHKICLCSTFTTRLPDGRLAVGRNLDFPSMGVAHRHGIVTIRRRPGARTTATVGWPGMLGSLTGMNDAGLAAAVMVVYFVADDLEGIPYALQHRLVLEEEETVDAAARRLAAEPSTNSNNLLLADGRGAAALLEIRPRAVERFDLAGAGALCVTNHFRGAGARPLTLHPLYLSSYVRRWRLGREGPAGGLASVRRTIRAAAPPLGNLQSMILLPEQRAMSLAMGSPPAARGRFVPFPAEVLFGGAPAGAHSGRSA